MYVLDNAARQAETRLAALASMFDPGTIRYLESCGIGSGGHCLEVGGGGGSIARWLAERVGPRGRVLATDIDTRHLEALRLPNLEVRRHDLAEEPLPENAFDVVHARLVLNAMPSTAGALERLAAALKPGGWLVVEEFEQLPAEYEPVPKTTGIMREVLEKAGIDPRYGRSLGARLRTAGLRDVDMEGRLFPWRADGKGAVLSRANREQLRAALLATGQITETEIDADLDLLDREEHETTSPILWTAWGRRAGA
jgi:SAM-dependent methyltransferase